MTAGDVRLVDRVIVVTGSAQGIGRATAEAAAAIGMRVVGLDVNGTGAAETSRRIRDAGGEAWDYECDVSRTTDIEAVFSLIDRQVGAVGALVNNAALVVHSAPEDITIDDWNRVIGVNLTGQAFVAQHSARSMIAAGQGGSIVNLTSIAGLAALGRGNFSYSVAKAGIIGMTRELAVEWASHGIRVNAVAPSQVFTEGFGKLIANENIIGGNILSTAVSGIPLGRLAETSDIVSAILFLLGDGAKFISGVTLPVDGGSLALHAGGSIRPAPDEGAKE